MQPTQLRLLPWDAGSAERSPALQKSIAELAEAEAAAHGAVFTRREIVEFMLDLVGYQADRDLIGTRLLEPSCGTGQFLVAALERRLTSYFARGGTVEQAAVDLHDAFLAIELHKATLVDTRRRVLAALAARGMSRGDAGSLADQWLLQDDFLLADIPGAFTHIVGNPPYVRQEQIPEALLLEYRTRFRTIYDRADLYIPFMERSLNLLAPGGQLGFICADRWMKNRYGGPLRQMVAERFHLKTYVDMVNTPAFHSDVTAYPAITVLVREQGTTTHVARQPVITQEALAELAAILTATAVPTNRGAVRSLEGVAAGAEPWVFESADQVALVRRLEAMFPTLEEAGCLVGIGVATGADKAFIGLLEMLEVETNRKLPLVTTRDIVTGQVKWHGLGVINPFTEDGSLVRLQDYPRLQRYLEAHKAEIAGRHIAQKNPAQWYRTIDKMYPALAQQPKLLIPDIKGEAHIVYEPGQFYPHHNLYYITSQLWDLQVLRAVLASGIARLFVSAYSTRMRGGYLRFQAQYLRRIRVPQWRQVPEELQQALRAAAERGDAEACRTMTYRLYGLSAAEQAALEER